MTRSKAYVERKDIFVSVYMFVCVCARACVIKRTIWMDNGQDRLIDCVLFFVDILFSTVMFKVQNDETAKNRKTSGISLGKKDTSRLATAFFFLLDPIVRNENICIFFFCRSSRHIEKRRRMDHLRGLDIKDGEALVGYDEEELGVFKTFKETMMKDRPETKAYSDEVFRRFLDADRIKGVFHVDTSVKRMSDTIDWRKDQNVDGIRSGKMSASFRRELSVYQKNARQTVFRRRQVASTGSI